jgi:hypothetical protein
MTETPDSSNTNDTRSIRLNYWKLIPLSLVICVLINLIAFGLRSVMFSKGELGELMLTLTISIVVPILIGTRLISKQKKNIGWAFVIGASLTLLFWIAAFYSLATHGW